MKETQEMWENLKTNKYQVLISDLVLGEISECSKKKREVLMSYLNEIDYALHIAVAILSNANMILSWNFKHLVNYNTINGVRQICFKKHLNRIIDICSPYVLLENEDN